MDSNEQSLDENSNKEQPGNEAGGQANTQPQTFDINWETVDIEELKKGYLRQSDYTKKTQELSNLKKESELSPEDKAAIDFLKKNNFVSKEDLENAINWQKQDTNLKDIIQNNPDLKPFEQAIKDLSKNLWVAPEDVIEKYGFKSKDKLQKAKSQWDIKWISNPTWQRKSISQMSEKEYAEYKAKMGIWTWWGFL